VKCKEEKKTLKRNLELYKALNEANDLFLQDTNLRLQGGDYGAWIELVDEERKDRLNQPDIHSYSKFRNLGRLPNSSKK